MLRRAIKENWEAPVPEDVGTPTSTHGTAFAAAFYAGNQDAPTARPSKAEISLSNSYIKQILKMWPETTLVEAHGRGFGEYVREQKPPSRNFRATFSVALRLFGDEFYKKLNHRRVAETRERVEAARTTHRKKHLQAYRDFVEKEEKRLRRKDSARYSEFLEKRAEDRARIERNQFIRDEEARAQILADHDAKRARLNDFLEFFCDDVPDFWTWDKDQNPKSFERATGL